MPEKNPSLESTLKSTDTEEPIDLLFYRPIGYRWALFFRKLGVHPNVVTILSIILGVGAGILFYFDDMIYNIIGMALLVWANSYDSADGQLARMTGQKSRVGRILDGLAGDFWFISIYVAICFRFTPEWSLGIWILAAVAGAFHSKQASMADYYRNIHLFFLKGKAGSELDSSLQEYQTYESLPWKGHFMEKSYHYFYGKYTAAQEKSSPKFQRFFNLTRHLYGDNMPPQLTAEFRKGSMPLMKYTNILSFNIRTIVLFICLFAKLPWIYFIFELTILNILLIYMVYKHEALCDRLYVKLKFPEHSEK